MALFLRLYNGRHDPDQDMDDMGFEGPEIGPLAVVHGTYTTHLMLAFTDHQDAAKFGVDVDFPAIPLHGDMLLHRMPGDAQVSYYGDWSVYWKGGV